MIKPALINAHNAQNATPEDSEASLVASLDALIGEIENTKTGDGENVISSDEKLTIKNSLSDLKARIINLDNDEEFKKTMQSIVAFKNSQGHQYSLNNILLIWIQNNKASFVMSEFRWNKYNKKIKEGAKKIWVISPSKRAITPYNDEQKKRITREFISKVGKNSYKELSVGEKDKLSIALRGRFNGTAFDFTPAYDITDVEQIEGKEDLLKGYEDKNNIKWSEDGLYDEKVKPIFNSMVQYAEDKNIKLDFVNDLGGAKGVSGSGQIKTLNNDGTDVGLTKTLIHEISHEILHQSYLKTNYPEMKQYFVGTSEGRDLVEQQAELAAWMVMGSYGFNLDTTSFNYAAIWGADKNQMVRVFDNVTGVVNHLIDYINNTINNSNTVNEDNNALKPANHISSNEIAKVLGVEKEFRNLASLNEMLNRYKKLI